LHHVHCHFLHIVHMILFVLTFVPDNLFFAPLRVEMSNTVLCVCYNVLLNYNFIKKTLLYYTIEQIKITIQNSLRVYLICVTHYY